MTWIDSRTSAQTCLGQSKRLFGQTDRAFKGPVLSEDQSVRVSNQPERDPGATGLPTKSINSSTGRGQKNLKTLCKLCGIEAMSSKWRSEISGPPNDGRVQLAPMFPSLNPRKDKTHERRFCAE